MKPNEQGEKEKMIDKHGMSEFLWGKVKGKSGYVKSFVGGKYTYPDGKKAICQIKGCNEVGSWIVEIKGIGRLLCFNHGENI